MKTFFFSLFFFLLSLYSFGQDTNLQEGDWSTPSACSSCLECNGKKVDGQESLKKITYTCASGETSKWYVLKHEAKTCNTIYFTVFGKASHDIHFSNLEEAMQYVQQSIKEQCVAKQGVSFQADDTIYEEGDEVELPTYVECADIENDGDRKTCEREIFNKNGIRYIKYPASAREKGIEGKVIIGIIVEKDGTVSDTEILKDIGSECGQTAITVINKAIAHRDLQWIPAKKNGVPVRFRLKVPVGFWLTR